MRLAGVLTAIALLIMLAELGGAFYLGYTLPIVEPPPRYEMKVYYLPTTWCERLKHDLGYEQYCFGVDDDGKRKTQRHFRLYTDERAVER